MSTAAEVIRELKKLSTPEKAKNSEWFFKTDEGDYGHGDKFLGIKVPDQRVIAKEFKDLPLPELSKLINDPIHEARLTAVVILVSQFKTAKKAKSGLEIKKLVDFYLSNLKGINNWDLVDTSCRDILGEYLLDKTDRKILYDFARSPNLWKQRISIISTMAFIKKGEFDDTFEISKILLESKHDLIQKAVGWMLRDIGDEDKNAEVEFLKVHYKKMPRTMLRYAVEKFDEKTRQKYLKGEI